MPTTSWSSESVDLAFRPKSYFWPLGAEKHLLTHIKGAARRAMLQRMIDEGRFDEIPEALAKAKLSEEERVAIGRIHPRFMGGEYLPDQEEDEVEIARIEIASTTFDVTSVYARRNADGTIHYRVVDEYGGDTLTGEHERDAAAPLKLGELESFFLGSWPLLDVLSMNFDADVEAMLDFFTARSEFYPALDRLLRQRVLETYGQDDEDNDDEVRGNGASTELAAAPPSAPVPCGTLPPGRTPG